MDLVGIATGCRTGPGEGRRRAGRLPRSKNAMSIDGLPGLGRAHELLAAGRARVRAHGRARRRRRAVSVGADLPYLTGYEAMPLERLTMLVLPRAGDAQLVVPRLEAPRVAPQPDVFEIVPWDETDDPIALVAELAGSPARAAIGDQTWARFVLDLQRALPATRSPRASEVIGPLRVVKDDDEIAALGAPRTRSTSSRPRCGCDRSRAGPSSTCTASSSSACSRRPRARELRDRRRGRARRQPASRAFARPVDRRRRLVLCDFGGTMQRLLLRHHADVPCRRAAAEIRDLYAVLADAQEAGVRAPRSGRRAKRSTPPPGEVIAAGRVRRVLRAPRRSRDRPRRARGPVHGLGERPPLDAGHTFSVEPGIYFPGRFGMRLEDIVVATADGPVRLNNAPRDLALVG